MPRGGWPRRIFLRHEQGSPTSPTSVTQGLRTPWRKERHFSVTGNVTQEHVCVCCSDSRTGLIGAKGKPAVSEPSGLLTTGRHQPSNADPDLYSSFSYLNLIKCRLGNLALIWFRPCAKYPTR